MAPIRPVIFKAPEGIDDDVVQLHLEHRIVQRLLGRFTAQGFVHHDLSRACLAQSTEAIPRVVMLGRLSLYGRDAEARTLELLEQSLRPQHDKSQVVPEVVRQRLLRTIARDIEELLPHLEGRGNSAKAEAEQDLADRGRIEADAMRHILEDQRKRVADALGKPIQMAFGFEDAPPEELRQAESNRRYWQRWLENVDGDLKREPARILDFYTVSSFRIEPVGVAYLWPATG